MKFQTRVSCHWMLVVLLIAAGAAMALAQNVAAPLSAAQESVAKPAPAPGADKEGLARCGLFGLVAMIATDYQSPACDNSDPANTRNNCLGVLDARNNVIAMYTMECLLGSNGGQILDVVITQDCTALVSNFGDSAVHFIDFSDPLNPLYKGFVQLPFFAEDIALSPDGEFALVTDGGFSSSIAVIRTSSMFMVGSYNFPGIYSNAVAVSSDGQTVLTADYFSGPIHVFLLDPNGVLTFVKSIQLPMTAEWAIRPVNVAISPDGRTALAANASTSTVDPPLYGPDMPVLRIDGPGQVRLAQILRLPLTGGVQTVGFAHNREAFFNYHKWVDFTYETPDPEDPEGPPIIVESIYAQAYVGFVDILGPGDAVLSGIEVPTGERGTSQLFGVDTLVAVPGGPYIYQANNTLSGANDEIYVIDLRTHTFIKTIKMPNSSMMLGLDHVYYGDGFLPIGLAFRQP